MTLLAHELRKEGLALSEGILTRRELAEALGEQYTAIIQGNAANLSQ